MSKGIKEMKFFIKDLKIGTKFYLDEYYLDKQFIKISTTQYKSLNNNKIFKIKENAVCFAENL